MAQPVWVLSVDLQTKTATFNTGLADAAKNARGAFNDIRSGAGEMGGAVDYSMGEARHSVMLLGEEFGIHLPRALTTFIAGLGPIGPALEAAFPFLAIAVGATLLIEHLAKMHEAGEKLTDDQVKFGTSVQNAFNTLDQKIIQAKIRADELRNDHLGALRLQLELIDKQSMGDLVHAFEEVAKAADVVMKDLEGHWYTVGIGSAGASHALQQFGLQYEDLLSKGKDSEAGGLLSGTLQQAQKILAAQKAMQTGYTPSADHKGDEAKYQVAAAAHVELQKAGVGWTEKEVAAQEQLVSALQKQVGMAERLDALKKLDSGNATKSEGNAGAAQAASAAREAAESQLRIKEQTLAADRATAEASMSVNRASIEDRLAADITFAERDRDLKQAANTAEIAGLDKSGKDYQNQLKTLNDKALEITNEFTTKKAELTAKASIEENTRDIALLQQSERQKIEATLQGTAARLAAIDAAIKEEQSRNLQDTSFFRDLLTQRVQAVRQEAEEEGKLQDEAAKEEADNAEKMGALSVAALKQRIATEDSARRVSIQQRIAQETTIANQEYTVKMAALEKEIQGLDKSGKDYDNKLKQIQDKEKQLTQQHEDELTAIKEKAEQERNQRILAADQQLNDALARGLTQSIMGHQSWAKMVTSLGDQVVSGMLENAIKSMLMDDMTKERDAAAAARKAFNIGMSIGGPAGLVLGPVFGAAAFASVMAFNKGTDAVPGMPGSGDSVPSMLTPGEGVVPGGVMDGLSKMARDGGFGKSGHTYHLQMRNTYHVNTVDGDGMQDALEKHSDQLQRHVENTLRKMNR